jgi:hypothetical protein
MLIALMVFFLLAVPAALLWSMLAYARRASAQGRVIAEKRQSDFGAREKN